MKTFKKIIISFIIIFIIIISIIVYKNVLNNNKKSSGTVTIEIIDSLNQISRNTYDFSSSDTLWDIIKENYEVRYEQTIYGITLYDIANIKTDFVHNYLSFYINDEYSTLGISNILLKDGMIFSIREMTI